MEEFHTFHEDRPDILRYCLHGLIFTGIMFFLTIIWTIVLVFLMMIGSIIGLIIGLVVLVLAIGFINRFVTELLWNDNIDSGWKAYLIHGLVLFLVLLIAGIPQLIANYVAPSVLISIITLVIYVPINGYLARYVSSFFHSETEWVPEDVPDQDW